MSRNGAGRPPVPPITAIEPPPSVEEAAAIAAAIERFLLDTAAPGAGPIRRAAGAWLRAGLLEGVGDARADPPRWAEAEPWLRPPRRSG